MLYFKLLFNLDYLKDVKTFADYAEKIKNSKIVIKEMHSGAEVFKLDDIDIRCTIPGCKLTIRDKQGNTKLEMDCAPDGVKGVDVDLQKARFKMCINLLSTVRQVHLEKTTIAKREKQARMAEQARLAKAARKEGATVKAARPDVEGNVKKLAAARGVIVEATKPQKGL
jgi:hypothetical protein